MTSRNSAMSCFSALLVRGGACSMSDDGKGEKETEGRRKLPLGPTPTRSSRSCVDDWKREGVVRYTYHDVLLVGVRQPADEAVAEDSCYEGEDEV